MAKNGGGLGGREGETVEIGSIKTAKKYLKQKEQHVSYEFLQ